MSSCQFGSVDLRLLSPPHSHGPQRYSPDWLTEARLLRSDVLYSNGQRPEFGFGGQYHLDQDEARDTASHHVVALVDGKIVGCCRLLELGSTAPTSVLDEVIGTNQLDRGLEILGVNRTQSLEASRLCVAPDYRRYNIARILMATVFVVGTWLTAPIIVAAMGTRDKQDRLVQRIGGASLPATNPVYNEGLADHVRPMYLRSTNPPNTMLAMIDGAKDAFALADHGFPF